jgi:hypothetical protein
MEVGLYDSCINPYELSNSQHEESSHNLQSKCVYRQAYIYVILTMSTSSSMRREFTTNRDSRWCMLVRWLSPEDLGKRSHFTEYVI